MPGRASVQTVHFALLAEPGATAQAEWKGCEADEASGVARAALLSKAGRRVTTFRVSWAYKAYRARRAAPERARASPPSRVRGDTVVASTARGPVPRGSRSRQPRCDVHRPDRHINMHVGEPASGETCVTVDQRAGGRTPQRAAGASADRVAADSCICAAPAEVGACGCAARQTE
ncbi:hypothetical protein AK812_SmicGene26892 [Symbiodinium microadriaticum]|uniref:Uncharacterized protein n=1 Tax=Symbiodinium microadriaticum TaxID=2951 RepID=A0A1Q9D8F7_SYMMI|nr:hypothetical protein AK812_SmicGene26892 [Symbiodinium microadriaticum]